MTELVVNGRYRRQPQAGVQRVATEIERRLKIPHMVVEPENGNGAIGHAWEQSVLPLRARGHLLWGPCNTGPLLSTRQVLTIHGTTIFDHPEWFSLKFVNFHRMLWPILARRALRILTVSQYSKQRIQNVLRVPEDKIDVVWNGVSEMFYPVNEAGSSAALQRMGLPCGPYFATLSTIEPRKNLGLVLRSWERVREKLPSGTSLVIIGSKGKQSVFGDLAELPGSAQRVYVTGFVPDELLPALLSGALAVLYPSLYEGFGLPVLEAMACGAPVITTRLTSLPEVGGDAALYVDPEDANELANLMQKLTYSSDMRKERSELGAQRARLFSWDAAANKVGSILARYL